MRLTVEQQKVLNKLARLYKVEWFAVIDGYTYDLEKGRIPKCKRSTENTIRQFWEGIADSDFFEYQYLLKDSEKKIIRDLLINLEITPPFDDEYTMANPIMIGL